MEVFKKGVIPHPEAPERDLHPLIWVGDTGSGSGMTERTTFLQYHALFGQPQVCTKDAIANNP